MSRRGRTVWLALALAACVALSGCRTRTTGQGQEPLNHRGAGSGGLQEVLPEDGAEALPEDASEADKAEQNGAEDGAETDKPEKDEASGGKTRENPEASRKEYDESRPAEIMAGAEKSIQDEGEGSGAFTDSGEAEEQAAKIKDGAEETARQTVAAEEAERKGTDEDAAEADSAMTYFTTLLQERTGSLFECQRLNVYWETAEDHVTIHRTSEAHALILDAGAYDVSGRLLAENLRVDDGWIRRKNPGVIVKAVDRRVLGGGVLSTEGAWKTYAALLAREGWQEIDAVRNGRVLLIAEEMTEAPHLRLAAMLMIAKTADAGLFADVEIGQALRMLTEEATGGAPGGIYYYSELGGF